MDIKETLARLAQRRDELNLQAHLFKAEARDRWEELEKSWHNFTQAVDRKERMVDDSDENVNALLRGLAGDIERGYKNFLNEP
jgi:hypothetical protein